jgi:hypothetical protein
VERCLGPSRPRKPSRENHDNAPVDTDVELRSEFRQALAGLEKLRVWPGDATNGATADLAFAIHIKNRGSLSSSVKDRLWGAQRQESQLPKLDVAGSSPVSRSICFQSLSVLRTALIRKIEPFRAS